jgi:uncharacterized membrane protein
VTGRKIVILTLLGAAFGVLMNRLGVIDALDRGLR